MKYENKKRVVEICNEIDILEKTLKELTNLGVPVVAIKQDYCSGHHTFTIRTDLLTDENQNEFQDLAARFVADIITQHKIEIEKLKRELATL